VPDEVAGDNRPIAAQSGGLSREGRLAANREQGIDQRMPDVAKFAVARAHGKRPIEANALVARRQVEPVLQGIRGIKGPELAVGNGGSSPG